jgi:hypothetical protein
MRRRARGPDNKKRVVSCRPTGMQYKKYNTANRGPRGPYKKKKDTSIPSTPTTSQALPSSTIMEPIPEDVKESLDYVYMYLDYIELSDVSEFSDLSDMEFENELLNL